MAPGSVVDVLETVEQGIFFVRWVMGTVEQGSGAVRMANGGETKESDGAGKESGDVEENASVLEKKKLGFKKCKIFILLSAFLIF